MQAERVRSRQLSISEWFLSTQEQREAIILQPRPTDPAKLIYVLVTSPGMPGKPIYLMVRDSTRASLEQVAGRGLPDELFLPYIMTPQLQSLLTTTTPTLIIVDSFSNFIEAGLGPLMEGRSGNLKLFFLLSPRYQNNYLQQQLSRVGAFLPNAFQGYFNVPFIPISFQEEIVQMTEVQDAEFSNRQGQEREVKKRGEPSPQGITPHMARKALKSLQIGNFYYPQSIQDLLNLPSKQRPDVPPDFFISEGGWIEPDILRNPAILGPKMVRLIERILEAPNEKQVIYTHFLEHHGAHLIVRILQVFGRQSILVTGKLSENKRAELYNLYNQSPTGVILITTVIPKVPLFNVTRLYFVEGVEPNILDSMLDTIYKRQYYADPPSTLRVYFLIARRANGTRASDDMILSLTLRVIRTETAAFEEVRERTAELLPTSEGVVIRY